ncbi:MAG: acetyl-CoA carboxylase, biotin carboxyl carrier protein [Acidiferrobacteraceae bacterium]|jgi:acetyl-CoA carboxylase biotin carboxyl carrier protein|nr:acetyl-CoA carboxylase, biotin carboxyl carrier protein [Acidiferrobacteraceae bacterium]|tara:strand:- start:3849 stop:4331 length:483 start_codon:yes stop_codon:yes gene_type:complete
MDIRKIKKLIEMLEDSQLNEIEITEGEESIRLSRGSAAQPTSVASGVINVPAAPTMAPPAYIPDEMSLPSTAPDQTAETAGTVHSPMVGTFYASPNPESKPYVEIGSSVSVGDTLCMIEAMKIFNHVEAETSGVVRKILKHSGDPVEYGEALFVIEENDT